MSNGPPVYSPITRLAILLRRYDYAQPGEHFVTFRTYEREHHLGEIENGMMRLSELGKIVTEEWLRTPMILSNVGLDEYVVMPDHVHGIIVLLTERNGVILGANSNSPRQFELSSSSPFRSPSETIRAFILHSKLLPPTMQTPHAAKT